MKKQLLVAFLSLGAATVFAQPTLTQSTSNPNAGDAFIQHDCDTLGSPISAGPSGAGVTWDFSSLVPERSDTITMISCAGTPYIDSFPGSTLAATIFGDRYIYFIANANKFAVNGAYYPVYGTEPAYADYYTKPDPLIDYPFTYGATTTDTTIDYVLTGYPYNDTNIVVATGDGYGTLILPSGTYTNVLRMHQVQYDRFTSPGSAPELDTNAAYYWFQPGVHWPLLEIDYQIFDGTEADVNNVSYYTQVATAAVADVNKNDLDMVISPNPASDFLTFKFTLAATDNTTITLSDISGRVVGTIDNSEIKVGSNEIRYPVAGLPAGMYLAHLRNDSYNITKKVIIAK